jgi:hypothetical protein
MERLQLWTWLEQWQWTAQAHRHEQQAQGAGSRQPCETCDAQVVDVLPHEILGGMSCLYGIGGAASSSGGRWWIGAWELRYLSCQPPTRGPVATSAGRSQEMIPRAELLADCPAAAATAAATPSLLLPPLPLPLPLPLCVLCVCTVSCCQGCQVARPQLAANTHPSCRPAQFGSQHPAPLLSPATPAPNLRIRATGPSCTATTSAPSHSTPRQRPSPLVSSRLLRPSTRSAGHSQGARCPCAPKCQLQPQRRRPLSATRRPRDARSLTTTTARPARTAPQPAPPPPPRPPSTTSPAATTSRATSLHTRPPGTPSRANLPQPAPSRRGAIRAMLQTPRLPAQCPPPTV